MDGLGGSGPRITAEPKKEKKRGLPRLGVSDLPRWREGPSRERGGAGEPRGVVCGSASLRPPRGRETPCTDRGGIGAEVDPDELRCVEKILRRRRGASGWVNFGFRIKLHFLRRQRGGDGGVNSMRGTKVAIKKRWGADHQGLGSPIPR